MKISFVCIYKTVSKSGGTTALFQICVISARINVTRESTNFRKFFFLSLPGSNDGMILLPPDCKRGMFDAYVDI